ncbi:acetate/propionate family kinase [Ectothiorhodospira sp. BSL-9]|uniref:acetate/propionate family kinase n=1 Tax=Ectothiorhodospira sp. BSL-9 TaxID=1442136 RepID=UPI0007B43E77|nr:acetate/propionate family kinase [Ectothiorhodospira sp. BSL-9]ANB03098.1 acetate kinase [Ectothiorhodospira sp. BSL-9]
MADILVINSGSSSIKFALFARQEGGQGLEGFAARFRGQFSGLGDQPHFVARDAQGQTLLDEHPQGQDGDRFDHAAALECLLDWVDDHSDADDIAAIGHRVVHGGRTYRQPARLDAETVRDLETLIPLAPLHQPHCLAPVSLLSELRPDVPQVACFDTSFHTTQPRVAQAFALPRDLTEAGLVRYGFHGLSYDYISRALAQHVPTPETGRVVVAHLGNGASLCAMHNGVSVASTMGFTALDGLPMGTRCGNIDPGLVLHLLSHENMTPDEVSRVLYKESGLLGVSGISSDMRVLLDSGEPSAREAVDLFVYRIVREIGSLASALGGLDHLVFTAGIGERASPVRSEVIRGCQWLGLEVDEASNLEHGPCISTASSRAAAWVIPTDEERMIAWHTAQCCD